MRCDLLSVSHAPFLDRGILIVPALAPMAGQAAEPYARRIGNAFPWPV